MIARILIDFVRLFLTVNWAVDDRMKKGSGKDCGKKSDLDMADQWTFHATYVYEK